MIIDGKLTVSKKKKKVLIDELRSLNFQAFPKNDDAKKSGEQEDVVENDEAEDADDAAVSANDYDYLLGVSPLSVEQRYILTFRRCRSGR
jgi:DNA topoisomerase-2